MSDTGQRIADALEAEIGGVLRGEWLWEHGISVADFERFLDAGIAEFEGDKPTLAPGDMVVMTGGGYHVAPENKGKVWVVGSTPWELGDGTEVVRLQGYEYGCYATDGLVRVEFPAGDD